MTTENSPKKLVIGGNLEKALSGKYDLSIKNIIEQAFLLTKKNYLFMLAGIIIYVSLRIALLWGFLEALLESPLATFVSVLKTNDFNVDLLLRIQLADFTAAVLTAPLCAGLFLVAISNSIGIKTPLKYIFKGFIFALPCMATAFIAFAIQTASAMAFIGLALIANLLLIFSLILVCEKKLSPYFALYISARAVLRKFLPLTVLFITGVTILGISFMIHPASVLLILPIMFNIVAVLYRDIFGIGVQVIESKNDKQPPSLDSFSA